MCSLSSLDLMLDFKTFTISIPITSPVYFFSFEGDGKLEMIVLLRFPLLPAQ